MGVIILHTEDEIKFLRLQKELIEKYSDSSFSSDGGFYALSPLWIKFADASVFFTDDLRECAKKINSVIIENPIFHNNTIICRVQIKFEEKMISGELELCKAFGKKNEAHTKLKLAQASSISFPYSLRIFRLGIEDCPCMYTQGIINYAWRKIPK